MYFWTPTQWHACWGVVCSLFFTSYRWVLSALGPRIRKHPVSFLPNSEDLETGHRWCLVHVAHICEPSSYEHSLNQPTDSCVQAVKDPLSTINRPCFHFLGEILFFRLFFSLQLLSQAYSTLLLQVIKMWYLVLVFSPVFWIKTKFPKTLNTQEKCKQNLPAYPGWFSGLNHWAHSNFP